MQRTVAILTTLQVARITAISCTKVKKECKSQNYIKHNIYYHANIIILRSGELIGISTVKNGLGLHKNI